MTKLKLRPYHPGDLPKEGSVPVTAVVLTRDEEPNIERCLSSIAWAEQILLIDSGSTDDTVSIAKALGAEVIEQSWLGYSAQRDFALRTPSARNRWIYFVDADEWVSPQLAEEIDECLKEPACAAYSQRFRFIFQGTWIRHCGWYRGSWNVRLINRHLAAYNGDLFNERARVDGPVHRLANDIVNEDRKTLAAWLHKHVRYAELEARRRTRSQRFSHRLHALKSRPSNDSRPLARAVLKDLIFPYIPGKPFILFIYMYIIRLGLLDGHAGLLFCFYRTWYEASVGALKPETMPEGVNVA
jgi:glycosyltransferase involved in cell wall biosynthesis